jgi:hypothetical protein
MLSLHFILRLLQVYQNSMGFVCWPCDPHLGEFIIANNFFLDSLRFCIHRSTNRDSSISTIWMSFNFMKCFFSASKDDQVTFDFHSVVLVNCINLIWC